MEKNNNNRGLSMSRRALGLMLAAVLLVGGAIGGTVAWLIDDSGAVVNTFTYGDINIDLWENEYLPESNGLDATKKVIKNTDYKFIPGKDLPKNPTVTVEADSEACWLFVKVDDTKWPNFTESDDETLKIRYQVNTESGEWIALDDNPGVYYRLIDAAAAKAGGDYEVLKKLADDKQIAVSETLTKDDIKNVTETEPQLTFTAYAVQYESFEDNPAGAWAQANPTP